MNMKAMKGLSPNRFQPIFCKQYWDVIGDDLWCMVREAFRRGHIDPRIVETLIVLIPKTENPSHLKNFHPISLCNVIYKVITRLLVNRLRPFLDELVGPLQGIFILRRGIIDNIIVAQEALNYMHKFKGRKRSLAFKLDLEKAYDSVN